MARHLVNTTFITSSGSSDDVALWLAKVYIPEALSSGRFSHPVLSRVLTENIPGADADATSLALQFRTDSIEEARLWIAESGAVLIRAYSDKLREQLLHFTTEMEILHS